jgi:hypothetical protein
VAFVPSAGAALPVDAAPESDRGSVIVGIVPVVGRQPTILLRAQRCPSRDPASSLDPDLREYASIADGGSHDMGTTICPNLDRPTSD